MLIAFSDRKANCNNGQVGAASHSQILSPWDNMSTCWKHYTAGHRQSRRLQECSDDNFPPQGTEEPLRRDAVLCCHK